MSVRVSILTISDRSFQGEWDDLSGPALETQISGQGWEVVRTGIVPDDLEAIKKELSSWADFSDQDVILTTGGTGFTSRDITPEATLAIIDRMAPGLAEAMRTKSLEITQHAMLSRAVVGIRGRTLIINLPGSPKAAVENLEVVLPVIPHAVQLLKDDPEAEAGH
ncbi:MAG: MogA/MoaB family molybdenum cofactor biosynthesis protein [Anaerolineales bacterium]|jgi:molybdenum cofactor synthesis domain-containing protein